MTAVRMKATKKKLGGHEFITAEKDDPFWTKAGYVPVDDEVEVDFDSMTVAELKQFVTDYDLTIDLDDYSPKSAKVEALEAYVDEHGLEPAPEVDGDADEDDDEADDADEEGDEDEGE